VVFGVCGALACNLALNLKHLLKYDDALDVFAVHGVGGIVGNILTGIFAQKHYSPTEIHGGLLDGNPMQIVHQLIDTVAGLGWSFVVTFIILFVMNKIPGLSLRVDLESERAGLDQAELGFSCYEHVDEVKTTHHSQLSLINPNGFGSIPNGIDGGQFGFVNNKNGIQMNQMPTVDQSRL